MAPQTDEFGTKVGLLAGPRRHVRRAPAPRSPPARAAIAPTDDLRRRSRARLSARGGAGAGSRRGAFGSRSIAGVVLVVGGRRSCVAGTPARGRVAPDATEVLDRRPARRRPGDVPADHGRPGRHRLRPRPRRARHGTGRGHARRRTWSSRTRRCSSSDASILHRGRPRRPARRDAGAGSQAATSSGTTTLAPLPLRRVDASLLVPFGRQTGLSLGLAPRAPSTEETYDATGALQSPRRAPFA